MWDVRHEKWHSKLLNLAAGASDDDSSSDDTVSNFSNPSVETAIPNTAVALKRKLGPVMKDAGSSVGTISPYFTKKYNFSLTCKIMPFTGDNPSTILSLPLRAGDAIVSLGTSTTFLMSTSVYKPHEAVHFMNHPTTPGLYMFMLCYKNGGLARERVRDALNGLDLPSVKDFQKDKLDSLSNGNEHRNAANHELVTKEAKKHQSTATSTSWHIFDKIALATPALNSPSDTSPYNMGLYFPRHEIIPSFPPGTWRYLYDSTTSKLTPAITTPSVNPIPDEIYAQQAWVIPRDDARAILESQFLSLRLRSKALVSPQQVRSVPNINDTPEESPRTDKLPPQPRRVYLAGGGSHNAAIARVAGDVLGGAEGVYRLDLGGNACALGAAYKAVWACERNGGQGENDSMERGKPSGLSEPRSISNGRDEPDTEIHENTYGLERVPRRANSVQDIYAKAATLPGQSDVNQREANSEQGSSYSSNRTSLLTKQGASFEEFVEARWNEEDFVTKVDVGYKPGVWEKYGTALEGFSAMEEVVQEEVRRQPASGR